MIYILYLKYENSLHEFNSIYKNTLLYSGRVWISYSSFIYVKK